MNAIKLYYLSLVNLIVYYNRFDDKRMSLIFSRVPLLSKIHNAWLRSVIYKFCLFLEPLASLIIVTLLLVPYCIISIITKKQPLGNELFIDNCPLLKARTIAAGKYDESIDWLYSFFVPKKDWDRTKRCHSLFEYVSFWNVIQSYVLSVITIIGSQTINKFRYIFKTYNCFEFFLTNYVLQNISPDITLCFCNQMDRWAILFDHAPQKNRVLFQHGIEMPTANWPAKFERTDTVYVLSKEESEHLFKAAFKIRPSNVYLLKPTIELTQMAEDDNIKVLIVGFPSYHLFEQEKALVTALNKDGITVYLKPHPGKEDMGRYVELGKKHSNCKIILEKIFPDVDLVCSYRSTLAVEYQAHNKFVMMYDDYSVDEMIEKIKELRKRT